MINNFKVLRGDVETAISIMKEVTKWGRSVGLNVWKDEHLTREKLLVGINEDAFYIGKISSDNACCMILQWDDVLFWPKAKENEAGYIHKLCVRREYSEIGLSQKMVEFAIAECRKRNIGYLRLDTGFNKKKLCNLYESLGFKFVGKILLDNRGEFALFEMKIH
ncbi:GNAT family N-acetyltransferase [Clostridium estertheticum]|uniref:GNAT family N-acetyltransferase n=1 Tax=Clostridium estertheticum TaxID=238834 RepID=A0A5N7IZV3_9CLOT|nr:GNAT family N-acetyltransferase [Clostridium estertheticum]MPQ31346.1 GNAT family N-acetyltransferase [Clostridium estertheticum]MPQ62020.1 GNAT family N-acetyltransferase [Clostridium estertheticum]